jgi:hypothetical protein
VASGEPGTPVVSRAIEGVPPDSITAAEARDLGSSRRIVSDMILIPPGYFLG